MQMQMREFLCVHSTVGAGTVHVHGTQDTPDDPFSLFFLLSFRSSNFRNDIGSIRPFFFFEWEKVKKKKKKMQSEVQFKYRFFFASINITTTTTTSSAEE